MPDELYDKVRECADELNQRHTRVQARAILAARYATDNFETRKDQAEWILANCDVASMAFKVLDERDIATLAWAAIKPELDRSWAFLK